jgi:hypothetical protein
MDSTAWPQQLEAAASYYAGVSAVHEGAMQLRAYLCLAAFSVGANSQPACYRRFKQHRVQSMTSSWGAPHLLRCFGLVANLMACCIAVPLLSLLVVWLLHVLQAIANREVPIPDHLDMYHLLLLSNPALLLPHLLQAIANHQFINMLPSLRNYALLFGCY